jgi:hypothetical protein
LHENLLGEKMVSSPSKLPIGETDVVALFRSTVQARIYSLRICILLKIG